jgi:tripartite-type tricarboxylate transporter receptor subunit TctC
MYRNLAGALLIFSVLAAVTSFPERISAQGPFPSRPITMIIDQGAGGMNDVVVRALCRIAEKELGQAIACENKPGGAGTLAVNAVIKQKADGYTLGISSFSTNIYKPHMENLSFDVRTDQTDIAVYLKYTHALCVKADAPWKTFEEVVTYARKNPGKFTYSTAGVGSTQHITMARIAMKEKINWSMVPFKSGSESVLACLGGHVSATAAGPADVIPHIEAGKLRLLFSFVDYRWPIAPNIPCALEKYGFWGETYKSIIGPAGMSGAIVDKLQNAFKKAIDDPVFVQLAKTLQFDRCYMSGKDYSKLWRSQYDEGGKIIRDMGLGK